VSDIVKVIEHYFDLKHSGDEYKACCPFHSEKSPSFTVVPNGNFFYCLWC